MRILCVTHLPWDRDLGAARVQVELAEEFERLGHRVDKVSRSEVVGLSCATATSGPLDTRFTRRARRAVRSVAHHYDVIDALEGDLPFSKREIGFEGLLVSRSVGLYEMYAEFLAYSKRRWPQQPTGTALGRALRAWRGWRLRPAFRRSHEVADVINVPNHDEKRHLAGLGLGDRTVVLPFGLSDERARALSSVAAGRRFPPVSPEVAFIGAWWPRKGVYDWGQIVHAVRAVTPASFSFLGTWASEEVICRDLGVEPGPWLRVVPTFESAELPELLRSATIGAFPSYIEGFGFAVLEQMASGLPTVTYGVPGVREMLGDLDLPMMVPRGDVSALAGECIRWLTASADDYLNASKQCTRQAMRFSWASIATQTIDHYERRLRLL